MVRRRDAVVVAVAVVVGLSAQAPRPAFQVAAVTKQMNRIAPYHPSAARPESNALFRRRNATVVSLIEFGYDVKDFQVVDGPAWVRKDLFTIEATTGGEVTTGQVRLMVQSLLQDRFALAVRRERRDVRTAYLTTARDDRRPGPGLRRCGPENRPPRTPREIPSGEVVLRLRCETISSITNTAAALLKAPVLDRTGLSGLWTADLTFVPPSWVLPHRTPRLADEESRMPSFETALRDQLGLELEHVIGPLEVLAIESVQRPAGQ
jgi:uncharacterized protein (TIGR03435 family)